MAYTPTVHRDPGTVAGAFGQKPQGVILHGSRSGIAGRPVAAEYDGTRRYAASGIELGWNVTVGHDAISLHMQPDQWGWNARQHSKFYLAVEFAQATAAQTITDGQVRAFCWWIRTIVRPRWPYLPPAMPMHSELPAGITDGKSDVYPVGDPRANELRARILAGLGEDEEADVAELEDVKRQLAECQSYSSAVAAHIITPTVDEMDRVLADEGEPDWEGWIQKWHERLAPHVIGD